MDDLAYENEQEDKVVSYITSINKLKNCIDSRLEIITDEDSKLDLVYIKAKIKHLELIISKLFDKEHLKKSICKKCDNYL